MEAAASFRTPQLQLLEAAQKAGVKRFAPSDWTTSEMAYEVCEVYKSKAIVWEAVKKSGLEYTAFRPGRYKLQKQVCF